MQFCRVRVARPELIGTVRPAPRLDVFANGPNVTPHGPRGSSDTGLPGLASLLRVGRSTPGGRGNLRPSRLEALTGGRTHCLSARAEGFLRLGTHGRSDATPARDRSARASLTILAGTPEGCVPRANRRAHTGCSDRFRRNIGIGGRRALSAFRDGFRRDTAGCTDRSTGHTWCGTLPASGAPPSGGPATSFAEHAAHGFGLHGFHEHFSACQFRGAAQDFRERSSFHARGLTAARDPDQTSNATGQSAECGRGNRQADDQGGHHQDHLPEQFFQAAQVGLNREHDLLVELAPDLREAAPLIDTPLVPLEVRGHFSVHLGHRRRQASCRDAQAHRGDARHPNRHERGRQHGREVRSTNVPGGLESAQHQEGNGDGQQQQGQLQTEPHREDDPGENGKQPVQEEEADVEHPAVPGEGLIDASLILLQLLGVQAVHEVGVLQVARNFPSLDRVQLLADLRCLRAARDEQGDVLP
ncbi:hypothetical protein IHN63_01320 [Deinococcus sp. 6YEL10]|uniref:hypothetical protein n=1 Tax=Deinococcus sp. 6YEL10 TaxID=2745870 RepID=UPI001E494E83|nr:hypothetical protein [Deinococcus sp. 6YEL10]MCD0159937.1 hypothetical protein [Deinococcus sp. 6YEL10]